MSSGEKILIYGYGNPGRQDDGLGIVFAEEIEKWAKAEKLEQVHVDQNYQLNIEDAYEIKDYDLVYFADASTEEIDNFLIDRVIPESKSEFTMHSVSPGFILNLCQEIYNKIPKTFLVHIKGYEWEFMEQMSSGAYKNLHMALENIKQQILKTIKN